MARQSNGFTPRPLQGGLPGSMPGTPAPGPQQPNFGPPPTGFAPGAPQQPNFGPAPTGFAPQQASFSDPAPAGFQPPPGAGPPPPGGGIPPSGFDMISSQVGDTTVFDSIMKNYDQTFQQRAQDYVSQGMASAGFLGNRYGSYGAREAGRQGERAALESQALMQPLLMQNLTNNLDLAQLGFGVDMFNTNRQDNLNSQYWNQLMQILGFGAPQGQYPTQYTAGTPGFNDFALPLMLWGNQ